MFYYFPTFLFILQFIAISINAQDTATNPSTLQKCPNGWSSWTDKNGNVYGYKVIIEDMINYYQVFYC